MKKQSKLLTILLVTTAVDLTFNLCKINALNENTFHIGNGDERGTLFEGDIATSKWHHAATTDINLKWPDAKVFYKIHESFRPEEKSMILSAMEEINKKACIQFKERIHEPDYVHVIQHRWGCWSYFGRIHGEQELNLGFDDCKVIGVVAHELMHALGVFHEHTRSDRSEYVHIVWSNMYKNSEIERNFLRRPYSEETDLDLPYDYGSIMHYSPSAFAKDNRLATIIPIKPTSANVVVGQRVGLSELDAVKLRILYNLTGVTCHQEDHNTTDQHQYVDDGGCPAGYFKCVQRTESKSCIDIKLKCDGVNNCGDFSDEENCSLNKISIGHIVSRAKARFYSGSGFSGVFEEYNSRGIEHPNCHRLNSSLADNVKSIDLLGNCVRVYQDYNCGLHHGNSIALYPRIGKPHENFLDLKNTPAPLLIKSIGHCFDNELDQVEIQLDARTGVKRFRKLFVPGTKEYFVPDNIIYGRLSYALPFLMDTTKVKLRLQFMNVGSETVRVEISRKDIQSSSTSDSSPEDVERRMNETLVYGTINKREGDTMGYFLSPSKFKTRINSPSMGIFPQTKFNQQLQSYWENRIWGIYFAPTERILFHALARVTVQIFYERGESMRPIGMSYKTKLDYDKESNLYFTNAAP